MNQPEPGYALESALGYAELGYTIVPIKEGHKYPPMRWKRYQSQKPDEKTLHRWFTHTRHGIALVCGELVMVDVDNADEIDFVLQHSVQKNSKHAAPICTTPRGGYHIHTRAREGVTLHNSVRIKGRDVDLRTRGGLAIVPPTRGYAWQKGRELLPLADLPVFKATWTRRHHLPSFTNPAPLPDESKQRIALATEYASRIEGAISGQGGHNRTMRVAGILIQKFNLTIEQSWPILKLWNETCEPHWSDKELMHKLHAAEKNKGKYYR